MMHTIGIDFGTTKTLVSWLNPKTNQVELVRLGQQGTDKIPTSIYIEEDGHFLFGEDADDQMQFDAVRYKRAFKLQLGNLKPAMIAKVNGKNQCFLARDLTCRFLEYIKTRCEHEVFLDEKISSVVITIPVSFSPAQKQDLERAAKDAGYCDVILLPEPEAAGLAFERFNPTDKFKSVMIVDWGGGTVDLAMISKNANGEIHSNADSFDGDETLGGEVFDEILWEHVINKIALSDEKKRDIYEEPQEVIIAMTKQIRICKERLSRSLQSRLILAGNNGTYSTNIMRDEFSNLIMEKVNVIALKLQNLLKRIYQRDNSTPEALIMIGGSSCIPIIQKILSEKTGLKCVSWQYAHEAVALGSAIYAANKCSHVSNSSLDFLQEGIDAYERGEYNYAFHFFSEHSNYPVAQYYLGNCYEDGNGVEENPIEAFKWFHKSAEQGYAEAQVALGLCYYTGEGVAKDLAEAVKWYRKAAKQELAEAQLLLGFCYENGDGVTQNAEESVKWYRKAAEQGLAAAQYKLGIFYDNGFGVVEDAEEAVKWYKESAKQDWAEAQNVLGRHYDEGIGIEQNKEEAVKWYRKAAKQELAEAQLNLGLCYQNGEGIKQDEVEAVKWYKKSAKQNYPEAQFYLGLCYQNGEGVEQDEVEAVKWYKKSAKQNYAEAQNMLGRCYDEGTGIEQNKEEAVKWYRKAAKQELAEAQYNLGLCYQSGEGVEQDVVEADKWLRKAAEQGYADAQFVLERLDNEPDNEENVSWGQTAEERDTGEINLTVAGSFTDSELNVDKPAAITRKQEFSLLPNYNAAECLSCGACKNACPTHAIVMFEGCPRVNVALCANCGSCRSSCPTSALGGGVLHGIWTAIKQIIK